MSLAVFLITFSHDNEMEGGSEWIHLCEINATAMWKKTSVSQEVRVRLEVVQHEAVKTCIPARGVYGREGSIMNSSSTL